VPRDGARLRAQLRQALEVSDAPTAVWFPPGDTGPDIDAVAYDGGVDVLRRGRGRDVLVVSVGAMAPACLEAARLLEAEGVCATVVDPCWVQPLDAALPRLAAGHRLVVTAADGGPGGGVEAALLQELNDARAAVPVLRTAPGPTGADIAHAVLGRLRDGT
jgi:1-deoxy-D-xylulose-5-phosphate synthase